MTRIRMSCYPLLPIRASILSPLCLKYVMYDLSRELEPLFFRMVAIVGKGHALRWQDFETAGKKIRGLVVINFLDGVRHIVFLVPHLSVLDARSILASADRLKDELALVKMSTAQHLDSHTFRESSDDLSFSSRLFFFTDTLQDNRASFANLPEAGSTRVVIINDDEWSKRSVSTMPDAFISHDSQDKEGLVRSLAHDLTRMGLRVWYDEFSLKPGDRLSESIDRGLTQCRKAILVVTPNLLSNTSWASVELSALLSRSIGARNSLIPIWSGVTKETVGSRSTLLADIVAIIDPGDPETLASRVYTQIHNHSGNYDVDQSR